MSVRMSVWLEGDRGGGRKGEGGWRDSKRKFKNGFRITNKGCKIKEAQAKNHKSATVHSRRALVEQDSKTQIEQDNHVIARQKPSIISPLDTQR